MQNHRINLKIVVLKALHGLATQYISSGVDKLVYGRDCAFYD